MERFKNVLLAGAGVVVVAQFLLFSGAGAALAADYLPRPQLVQVVNKATEPVPVASQGTATVQGAVTVANLPLDPAGSIKVSVPTVRVILMAQNVVVPAGGIVTTPLIDTADCRQFVVYTETPSSPGNVFQVSLMVSPDGTASAELGGYSFANLSGFDPRFFGPHAGLRFRGTVPGGETVTATVGKAWLFCQR